MLLFSVLAGALYLLLIGAFFGGWIKTKTWEPNCNPPNTKVSVVIPLRNEAYNLPQLFQSLAAQNYPDNLLEIIFVNDHSSDNSLDIIKKTHSKTFRYLNLPMEKEGKKAALLEGLTKATGELIITTDADCIPNADWVKTIVSFYNTFHSKMIVAPVTICPSNGIFSKFQELEFLSLQGSTAGAIAIGHPIMCNGANLAFASDCLPIITETYANTQTASGDDIFALLAIKNLYPGQVHYLKSFGAIVTTNSAPSVKSFFNQRKRWTTKSRYYSDPFLIVTALIVLIWNLIIFVFLIQAIRTSHWIPVLSMLALKSIMDLPFLYSVSGFFKTKKRLWWFPVFQSFYFLYISFTFALSLFGGYTWKLRKIRV